MFSLADSRAQRFSSSSDIRFYCRFRSAVGCRSIEAFRRTRGIFADTAAAVASRLDPETRAKRDAASVQGYPADADVVDGPLTRGSCRGFPRKVTAFRDGMAVHGRYGKPCPDCGAPIQRIRYAQNETNYCPPCQTGGRLLADRALSRFLKKDWPKTLEELEALGGP